VKVLKRIFIGLLAMMFLLVITIVILALLIFQNRNINRDNYSEGNFSIPEIFYEELGIIIKHQDKENFVVELDSLSFNKLILDELKAAHPAYDPFSNDEDKNRIELVSGLYLKYIETIFSGSKFEMIISFAYANGLDLETYLAISYNVFEKDDSLFFEKNHFKLGALDLGFFYGPISGLMNFFAGIDLESIIEKTITESISFINYESELSFRITYNGLIETIQNNFHDNPIFDILISKFFLIPGVFSVVVDDSLQLSISLAPIRYKEPFKSLSDEQRLPDAMTIESFLTSTATKSIFQILVGQNNESDTFDFVFSELTINQLIIAEFENVFSELKYEVPLMNDENLLLMIHNPYFELFDLTKIRGFFYISLYLENSPQNLFSTSIQIEASLEKQGNDFLIKPSEYKIGSKQSPISITHEEFYEIISIFNILEIVSEQGFVFPDFFSKFNLGTEFTFDEFLVRNNQIILRFKCNILNEMNDARELIQAQKDNIIDFLPSLKENLIEENPEIDFDVETIQEALENDDLEVLTDFYATLRPQDQKHFTQLLLSEIDSLDSNISTLLPIITQYI